MLPPKATGRLVTLAVLAMVSAGRVSSSTATGAHDTDSVVTTIQCTAQGPVEIVLDLRSGKVVRRARVAGIVVAHAWVVATPGGASFSEGYLTVLNNGARDRLVSVTSSSAADVEIIGTNLAKGGFREAFDLTIPEHGALSFSADGDRLILLGLTLPLDAGDTVPLTLTFERAGAIHILAPVRAALNDIHLHALPANTTGAAPLRADASGGARQR